MAIGSPQPAPPSTGKTRRNAHVSNVGAAGTSVCPPAGTSPNVLTCRASERRRNRVHLGTGDAAQAERLPRTVVSRSASGPRLHVWSAWRHTCTMALAVDMRASSRSTSRCFLAPCPCAHAGRLNSVQISLQMRGASPDHLRRVKYGRLRATSGQVLVESWPFWGKL